jgi:hypothetical protein
MSLAKLLDENGAESRYLIQRKTTDNIDGIDERLGLWEDVTWVTVPRRASRKSVLQAAVASLEAGTPVTVRALDEASAKEHSGTPQLRFV